MKARRLLASTGAVLTAACALALFPSTSASAHPLGNFTVNRYDGLVAAPGTLRVDHVEDLAEIPATQARPDIKRLGMSEWARQRCAKAADGSKVTVDGRATALTVGSSQAHLRPGQAGLNTLRVECGLTAPLPKGDTVHLGFHSAGASSGPGWREITARGDRMTLTATDVPKTSVSHELTSYPKELLSSPADTSAASLRVRAGGPALLEKRQDAPAASVLPRGADRWTRALDSLVARHDLTLGFATLALLVAIVLGAMHALAPGHGKTLMAATAAARGGRARLKDVMPLAASVTVTHTLGVVALGLLVTAGSAAAPSVIAWLGIASGVMVACAGATLVRRVWRNRTPGTPTATSPDTGIRTTTTTTTTIRIHMHIRIRIRIRIRTAPAGTPTRTGRTGPTGPRSASWSWSPPTPRPPRRPPRPTHTSTRPPTRTITTTLMHTTTTTTTATPPTPSSTPTAASPTPTPPPRPSAARSCSASRAVSCPAPPRSSCSSERRRWGRPGSGCCSSSRTAPGSPSPSPRPGSPSSSWVRE